MGETSKKLLVAFCVSGSSLPGVQVENGCSFPACTPAAVGNPSSRHTSTGKLITHSFQPTQFVSGEKVCRTFFIFLQFKYTSKAMFSKP